MVCGLTDVYVLQTPRFYVTMVILKRILTN